MEKKPAPAWLSEVIGYPKPQLSQPGADHPIYPYLLKVTTVERVNQVWSTDITYIRMAQGVLYLVAVMDWFSRFVLNWSLSLTMEVEFCVEALKRALRRGWPDIINCDQGSQFTSEKFTGELAGRQIAISMDGRGRCMDNIFVERLWRSLKYEGVYLKNYASVTEARRGHCQLLPVLQPRALAPEPRLPDAGSDLPGVRATAMTGQTIWKRALLDSGTPSLNPWGLSLSRQNVCSTMKALERRIGLRRDATRAPIQGPEWQGAGFHSRTQNSNPRPRRALAYCGHKMVLTMGPTLNADCPAANLLRTRFQSIADSAGSVPFVISRNLVVAHQKPDNDQDARNAETPRDQILHVYAPSLNVMAREGPFALVCNSGALGAFSWQIGSFCGVEGRNCTADARRWRVKRPRKVKLKSLERVRGEVGVLFIMKDRTANRHGVWRRIDRIVWTVLSRTQVSSGDGRASVR